MDTDFVLAILVRNDHGTFEWHHRLGYFLHVNTILLHDPLEQHSSVAPGVVGCQPYHTLVTLVQIIGEDAEQLLDARKSLGDAEFTSMLKGQLGL